MADAPIALVAEVPGASLGLCRSAAFLAKRYAQQMAPKLSGRSAKRIGAEFGDQWFSITWQDASLWFASHGTKSFTMRNLSGVIPMWVDADPSYLSKNPKTETRYYPASQRRQMLIFRYASPKGSRKLVSKRGKLISKPRSYPGAPGRIGSRGTSGQIAPGNVGVRWHHPARSGSHFLEQSLLFAAQQCLITPKAVKAQYADGSERTIPRTEYQ